jgi:hypothetical protein
MSETIITIVPSLSNGGTERVGILLAKAFKDKGFKSYLFYFNNVISNSNKWLFDYLDLVFCDVNNLWEVLESQNEYINDNILGKFFKKDFASPK